MPAEFDAGIGARDVEKAGAIKRAYLDIFDRFCGRIIRAAGNDPARKNQQYRRDATTKEFRQ
jgi:hypothetical protein